MFIKPIKRSSYTLQRFSKHIDVESTEHFRLQKRKKFHDDQKGVFRYRIITKGNPYYEIAFSNDFEQLKENEWRYVTEEIPKRMPINLPAKAVVLWIISHFTCLGMENSGDGNVAVVDQDHEEEEPRTDNEDLPDRGPRPSLKLEVSPNSLVQSHPMLGGYVITSTWRLTGFVCFFLLMLLTNLAFVLLREATSYTFFTALVAMNIGLFMFVILGTPAQIGFSILEPAPASAKYTSSSSSLRSSAADVLAAAGTDTDEAVSSDEEIDTETDPSKPVTLQAGAHTGKGSPTDVTAKGFVPGASMHASSGALDVNAYSDPQGPSFAVRCGPNYKKNKLKAPSTKSLFNLVAMDVFESQKKIIHLGKYLDHDQLVGLPSAPYVSLGGDIDAGLEKAVAAQAANIPEHVLRQLEADAADAAKKANTSSPNASGPGSSSTLGACGTVPTDAPLGEVSKDFHFGTMDRRFVFIICMQIPTYAPAFMASGNQDGPGITLVWYLQATEETQRDLLRAQPVVPAVRLLKGLCEADPNSEEGGKWLHRMKTIPRLVNDDDFEFNWTIRKTIKQYNGKPFLTRPQHRLHKGPGYVNVDVDIHNFCYMARKVLFSFLDKLDKVILDWAFTIEAYDDEEQPEVILGAVRLFKIQTRRFPSWEATLKSMQEAKEGRDALKREITDVKRDNGKDGKDKTKESKEKPSLPTPASTNAASTSHLAPPSSASNTTVLSKSPSGASTGALNTPSVQHMSPERKSNKA